MIRYNYILQHKNNIKDGFIVAQDRDKAKVELESRFPSYTNLELVNHRPYKKRNTFTVAEALSGSDLLLT
jgi:hypothetical protein